MAAKNACPLCGKPQNAVHKPFCGQGCRDRDLLQWLGEGYRLPAGPADAEQHSAGVDSEDGAD